MSHKHFKYPGTRTVTDGNTAAVSMERDASDAAGAYPITPSTQMGELFAAEAAKGYRNISNRPLIFIEPEGEHAAAAVTAGLSMTGLRATNFTSGQGLAYMHESLYAAVGKRLTYILHVGCRAMTKASLNVHAGHDDYHAVDDTGFFQLFARNVQEVADLTLIAHRIAELALTPGIVAQDGFLTTHLIESCNLPERELVAEFLGRPEDTIDSPTPAQRYIYGPKRRRIPELWNVDNPVMIGVVQNQDAYAQSVAAQKPFFFDHIASLTDLAMEEYRLLCGRGYRRIQTFNVEDADYLIIGQGSVVDNALAVARYLRSSRNVKIGVIALTMFRPFPGSELSALCIGRKGITVFERTDQPLAEDLPIIREVRAAIYKTIEISEDHLTLPRLYSACFGLGSRDLKPEAIIGAIENMLPDGRGLKRYYVSFDFAFEQKRSFGQQITEKNTAYPHLADLVVKGSENPDLMPQNSITVRIHSIGGWGAIATGKNLAMTLFEMFGYQIKANPKYGSEKKGQPTTFYLACAEEPILLNCEYHYVDVVLSPDPNVFGHSNPLAGLKENGLFVIQSNADNPKSVWQDIPSSFRKIIIDKKIRVFYLDALRIARSEASDKELQFRMQGIAFQGAFFAASTMMKRKNLDRGQLFDVIENQLRKKFGEKGERIVQANLAVVRRGFDEVMEIVDKFVIADSHQATDTLDLGPASLHRLPFSHSPLTDIHAFWQRTGSLYAKGLGNDNPADPFIAMSLIPASTSVFRDMTAIRFEHPVWQAGRCTGCGECWTVCPDSAIPGVVVTIDEMIAKLVDLAIEHGYVDERCKRHIGTIVDCCKGEVEGDGSTTSFRSIVSTILAQIGNHEDEQGRAELARLKLSLKRFDAAITQPFYHYLERRKKHQGGLLYLAINPASCKGCMECVEVCRHNALTIETQKKESVQELRLGWDLYLRLPNTQEHFKRIDLLEDGAGILPNLLLDKTAYFSMNGGDGACVGCGEKTAIHLFIATVNALIQKPLRDHLKNLDRLIERLTKRIGDNIDRTGETVALSILERIDAEATFGKLDGSTSDLAEILIRLLDCLKYLRYQYNSGVHGRGRSFLGMTNSTGCTTVWGSTYPLNPYPFPWTNHLFQDSCSLAMGIFEGHMGKMAEGFKAVRMAEAILDRNEDPLTVASTLTFFTWEHFSDEEFHLCPPVIALGGDGAMYDIGFQNLSRLLMSGKPVKVLVCDTQVYSNTGGQACTSGFLGQISDMADYGTLRHGKQEIRKEIALIAMAHRTTFVLQSSVANPNHMIEGFISGLRSRRPALFNIYTTCPPEHGVGDHQSTNQAKLAVESRAYPLFRFDPDRGKTIAECCDLDGNPDQEKTWPDYTISFSDDDGQRIELILPITFADFAATEGRFRKHFTFVPKDQWTDQMITVAEYLDLPNYLKTGKIPFVFVVGERDNSLLRFKVSTDILTSCIERRDFWLLLRQLATKKMTNRDDITRKVANEMVNRLTNTFLSLSTVGGNGKPNSP